MKTEYLETIQLENKEGISYHKDNYQKLKEFDSEGVIYTGATFDDYLCRNKYLLDIIHGRKKRILDLAGGDGYIIQRFKHDHDVYLYDASLNALKIAREKRGIERCFGGFVEHPLPYRDNFFDYVFWGDNIEHVYYPQRTLREILRILNTNGIAVISMPNMGYWFYRLWYVRFGNIPSTEVYVQDHWLFEHIRFFNERVFRKMVKEEKRCRIVAMKPIVKGRFPRFDAVGAKFLPSLFSEDLLFVLQKVEDTR